MEGIREFTCKEGLLLKEEQRLGKWKKRWMVLRVNEKGDPSLYYYQVDDYINECMPLGFVIPSCCTLFEYPARNFAFELVSPPSYNGLSPRPATHFRFQATNTDEFKSWVSVLSLYTMPIEEMHNAARNGSPVRSHSEESFVQSPVTRSPSTMRSKEWEDNEAVLVKLFPDVELQTIVDALEFCRGNRNDAIDLLAEQNKLSNSTNNKNLMTGLSPQNFQESSSGQGIKRVTSTRHLSQTPTLISAPSPFLSPDFSSSIPHLRKDLLTPPSCSPSSGSIPLSMSSLSLSGDISQNNNNCNNNNSIPPPPPPLPPLSVYKPKPMRVISSNNNNNIPPFQPPIVPPIRLPLPSYDQSDDSNYNINSNNNNNIHEQQQQPKAEENQQSSAKQSSPPPPSSSPPTSSTPQTPPSLQMPSSLPASISLPPLTIPSSPPPSTTHSHHYMYYSQQRQQQQSYQPLVSPHSPPASLSRSSSSSQLPNLFISLQSTPQSPHSPLSPHSPTSSSPHSNTSSASSSPRLHHQFTNYRYLRQSAPMMGHSTIHHFEAYSSDDSSSPNYHAYSHPHYTPTGLAGLANYNNHFGSPSSPGAFSPHGSPNFGNFHALANSRKPSPISFRIVGATRNTYYMDYIVEVVTPELRWLVYRRYSNFSLLNAKLLKMEMAHPVKNVLPPKQFSLSPFPPPFASDDLVNKRIEGLGSYLNSLVEDTPSNAKFFLSHPIGQAFIDPHITSNEHNKFVNNIQMEK